MKAKFENMGCFAATLLIIGIIALAVGIFCLEGWAVMALWNWLAVGLFSAPAISFKMALGIMVLLNLLTGGLRVSTSSSRD